MKQKQRDECNYRSIAHRLTHRHRGGQQTCNCQFEINHYEFGKYRHSHPTFREDELKVDDYRGDDLILNSMQEGMESSTYTNIVSESLDDCYNIDKVKKQKKSKRQQKIEKKLERTIK